MGLRLRSDLGHRSSPPAFTYRALCGRGVGPTRLRRRRSVIVLSRSGEVPDAGDDEVRRQRHHQRRKVHAGDGRQSAAHRAEDGFGQLEDVAVDRVVRVRADPRENDQDQDEDDQGVEQVDQQDRDQIHCFYPDLYPARGPNSAWPNRSIVLPAARAASKSPLIPIERTGRPFPICCSASSWMRRSPSKAGAGSPVAGPMPINPCRSSMLATFATSSSASSGATPDRCASRAMLTSTSTAWFGAWRAISWARRSESTVWISANPPGARFALFGCKGAVGCPSGVWAGATRGPVS